MILRHIFSYLSGGSDHDKIVSTNMTNKNIPNSVAINYLSNDIGCGSDNLVAPCIPVSVIEGLEVAQINLAKGERDFFL